MNNYKTTGTPAGNWYLPAMGELKAISDNMDTLNTTLNKINGTKLPSGVYHWSSNEGTSGIPWSMRLDGCWATTNGQKNFSDLNVRPILSF